MRALLALALLALPALAAEERFTPERLEARFYYDLGPKEVDTAAYPPKQRENYRAFAAACSQCHTLARPLNAPYVSREDWKRYVKRMHAKTKERAGASIGKADAEAAVVFLAYDAQIRKVKGRAAFEAKTAELKALFAEVRAERSRLQIEADRRKARGAP